MDSLGNFWGWNFPGRKKQKKSKSTKIVPWNSEIPTAPKNPKIFGNFLPTSPNPGDHFGMNGGEKKRIPGISQGSAQVGEKKKSLWDILGFFFSQILGYPRKNPCLAEGSKDPKSQFLAGIFPPQGKTGTRETLGELFSQRNQGKNPQKIGINPRFSSLRGGIPPKSPGNSRKIHSQLQDPKGKKGSFGKAALGSEIGNSKPWDRLGMWEFHVPEG